SITPVVSPRSSSRCERIEVHGGPAMRQRALVIVTLVVFLLGGIMPGVAFAQGGRGGGGHASGGRGGHGGFQGGFHRGFHHGHHAGCCWWGGALVGGVALGAALTYPYWWDYPYSYPDYYGYRYPYPAYAPPVIEESPVVYESAPVAAEPVQREVVYPNGKYV